MNTQKNRTTKSDVVLTHCSNRIGYNVLKSLAQQGLRVVVGVDRYSGMSVFSRYRYDSFVHPSFIMEEEAFIGRLRAKLRQCKPDVCIPTDEDIFVIAQYLDKFKDLPVRFPIADWGVLNRLHDKYHSIELAKSFGIPTPETIMPQNKADVFAFLRDHQEPIVLKIVRSSSASGVYYLTQKNISAVLDGIMGENGVGFGDFIVQQYKRGTGYGVSMLFNHGELRAKFTHKRLREKVFTGGPSTVRVGIKNVMLEKYAEQLLRNVGFHGVAMVEFKHNEQNGKSFFLEVNPRFWGSLALAIKSGVDFPYLLYRMAKDGDVEPCLDYTSGIVVKWLLGDILSILNHIKSTHSIVSIKDIFVNVHGYDDCSWEDPLPLAAECFLYLNKLVRTRIFGTDQPKPSEKR